MAQEAAIPAAPLKKRATMFNLLPNTASACRPRIQPTVAAKFPPAQRGPTGSAGQVAPRGLTLIELLVAVALIGILAALAVPGLAAAKRAARKTACLNNLKQLQLCWHLYVTDHDDAVPPNRSLMTNGVWRSTPDSWIGFSSAPHDADTRAIEQGLLYRYDYNREVRVYDCPERPQASQRHWLHRCPSAIECQAHWGLVVAPSSATQLLQAAALPAGSQLLAQAWIHSKNFSLRC